jgi:uncharacterized Zn-finger protein
MHFVPRANPLLPQSPSFEAPMPDGTATLAPTEIIHVDSRTVACDGGDGALGHPRVFLRIAGSEVICPYCSRLYVLDPGAGERSSH